MAPHTRSRLSALPTSYTSTFRATDSIKPRDIQDPAAEILRQFHLDPFSNRRKAFSFLEKSLQPYAEDQHVRILNHLKAQLEKEITADHALNHAVVDMQTSCKRKAQNLARVKKIWHIYYRGTEDFIPQRYMPPHLSVDLLQEYCMLSKDFKSRRLELSELWVGTGAQVGILPALMEREHVTQRRSYITVNVVKKARKQIKAQVSDERDTPGDAVEEYASGESRCQSIASERSIEVGRHAVTGLPDHGPDDSDMDAPLDNGLNNSAMDKVSDSNDEGHHAPCPRSPPDPEASLSFVLGYSDLDDRKYKCEDGSHVQADDEWISDNGTDFDGDRDWETTTNNFSDNAGLDTNASFSQNRKRKRGKTPQLNNDTARKRCHLPTPSSQPSSPNTPMTPLLLQKFGSSHSVQQASSINGNPAEAEAGRLWSRLGTTNHKTTGPGRPGGLGAPGRSNDGQQSDEDSGKEDTAILVNNNPIQEVPFRYLRQALRSMESDTKLNDDAVNMSLRRLQHDDVWVADTLEFEVWKKNADVSRRLREHCWRKPAVRIILIPFFHKAAGHWSLFVGRVSDMRLDHYNSASNTCSPEATLQAQRYFIHIVHVLMRGVPGAASVIDSPLPQQENDTDCGIFLLAAAHAVTKQLHTADHDWHFPKRWNIPSLRAELAAQLATSSIAAPADILRAKLHKGLPRPRAYHSRPTTSDGELFDRWLQAIEKQRYEISKYRTALALFQGHHKASMQSLDQVEDTLDEVASKKKAIIETLDSRLHAISPPSSAPSTSNNNLTITLQTRQRYLQSQLAFTIEASGANNTLESRKDVALAQIHAHLLTLKTVVVLGHVIGPRLAAAQQQMTKMDSIDAIQKRFRDEVEGFLIG